MFCIIITFNDPKSCFSNKKCIVSMKTCTTKVENNVFLIETPIFRGFSVQNQLSISFGTALVCNKISKVKN